jgi:hypothetical protein
MAIFQQQSLQHYYILRGVCFVQLLGQILDRSLIACGTDCMSRVGDS